MKKLVLFFCLLISLSAYSQRTGISYQALIINPDGEQLPGFNNQNAPLVNTAICLEFIIIDHNNSIEYSEYQSVTTDKYGMVNLTIGTGNFAGGSSGGWDNIIWSENSKRLKVRLDVSGTCSGFVEISDQELTSAPFALFAPGQEGRDGDSAYEIWLSEGNVGTKQQFLDSLKGDTGEEGDEGKSAYQVWLDAGNTGTEEEFLASLKGEDGVGGADSINTLVKTSLEAAGTNCTTGGVKIEYGLDSNTDGTLSDDEIDATLTKYVCNGLVNSGNEKGNTPYWDGEKWVVNSSQLYNDGSSVMVGTNTVVESSAFTVQSTSKGFLVPRMSAEQKNAIQGPVNGLLVYQTDGTAGFYYYDGSSWLPLKSQNTASGTGSDTNTLIYTTDGF
ncbi:hypothetical protein OA327_02895 [Flavobacteriales bacterium]|nr:hypothetical protein [Flavobacteriales bacterium]